MKRIMMVFVCIMTMAVSTNAQNDSIRREIIRCDTIMWEAMKQFIRYDTIKWDIVHFQKHIYGIGLPEPERCGFEWLVTPNTETSLCPFCRQESDDLGYGGYYGRLVRERQKCKEYRDYKRAMEKDERKRDKEIAEERRMKYEKYLSLSNGTRKPKSSIDEFYR